METITSADTGEVPSIARVLIQELVHGLNILSLTDVLFTYLYVVNMSLVDFTRFSYLYFRVLFRMGFVLENQLRTG